MCQKASQKDEDFLPTYTAIYTKPIRGYTYVEPNDCDRSIFDRSDLIVVTDPSLSAQMDPTVKSERRTTFWSFWISDPKIFPPYENDNVFWGITCFFVSI